MGGLGSGGARPGSGPKARSLRDRALTNPRIRLGDADRVAAFPAPPPPASPLRDWRGPTKAQWSGLKRRGRAFVTSRLATYGHSPHEGDVVMRAARALDESELWRQRAHRWKDPVSATRAARLQLLFEREHLNALAMLKETK